MRKAVFAVAEGGRDRFQRKRLHVMLFNIGKDIFKKIIGFVVACVGEANPLHQQADDNISVALADAAVERAVFFQPDQHSHAVQDFAADSRVADDGLAKDFSAHSPAGSADQLGWNDHYNGFIVLLWLCRSGMSTVARKNNQLILFCSYGFAVMMVLNSPVQHIGQFDAAVKMRVAGVVQGLADRKTCHIVPLHFCMNRSKAVTSLL